jgi:type II secretory pathway component PulJ
MIHSGRSRRHQPGFTLVELLIGMSLTILVGGVLYLLQSTGLSSVAKGTARLSLHSEIRRAMELVSSDLRCAAEILEINPDAMRIRRYRETEEEGVFGDAALVTVVYSLEKTGRTWNLFRQEGGNQAIKILSADHIDEDLFQPYFQTLVGDSGLGPAYERFDCHTNDSDQRQRITFVRVKMHLRQNREFATVVTSVALRAAQARLAQPNWNFH